MSLSESERQRYSRQILLPGIGAEGQEKLKASRILLVGVGGLGSPASLYLAAAGVGTLGLIDDDRVSMSNLQRQILYDDQSAGEKKVTEAKRRLIALNPHIEIKTYDEALTQKNVRALFSDYDLILDGTDNFKTRYLISQACLATRKPHVYAGIFRFEGQLAIFTNETACYRCLFPQTPEAEEIPNCSEAGVLGALPGVIGSAQALEAMKYILQLPVQLGRLFVFDALYLESRSVQIPKREHCSHCSSRALAQGFDDTHLKAEDPIEIEQQRRQLKSISESPAGAVIIDVRTREEFAQGHQPGARHIPLAELADAFATLPKEQTYVVYCASGQRSLRAQALFIRNGFRDVWNVKSGFRPEMTEPPP